MTVPLFGAEQEVVTSDDYYTPAWVRRFIELGNGIALLPMAKAAWMHELWVKADVLMLPRQGGDTFRFVGGPPAADGSIFMGIWFTGFGEWTRELLSRIGHVR